MFSQRELDRLGRIRERLHRRIAARRADCVAAAAETAVPLALVDRVVALWRRISPLAARVKRPRVPGQSFGRAVWEWVPAVLGLLRRRE